MPNGDVWAGRYNKKGKCIKGLEEMMMLYSVKPFHFILIHYLGGPDFELEVFSPYAVEIDYPFRSMRPEADTIYDNVYDYVEADRHCAALYFNALNLGQDSYEIVLQKEHVTPTESYQVWIK